MDKVESEQYYVSKYMNHAYNYNPEFIKTNKHINIPDCYYKFNNELFAVEVTRYFIEKEEKEYRHYISDLRKIFKSDNFIENIYTHLGKRPSGNAFICFNNWNELLDLIINNINYIKAIEITCEDSSIIKKYPNKDNNIETFLESVKEEILDGEFFKIEVKTKKKYTVILNAFYSNRASKKIIPFYRYPDSETKVYDNIKDTIVKKNNKFKEYKEKLEKNNIKYNKYVLVLYDGGIPAEINTDFLYKKIIEDNLLIYDEIAIFLYKQIMIINKNDCKIVDL